VAAPTAGPASPADPWWAPLPAARQSFVPAPLVIEKLHVLAPIEVKGVDTHDQMVAPDRPTDAAWYNFTARPGSGSNAVFSRHRDFAKVGPAIFWHLDQLAPGDVIDVVSPQHTQISYRVTRSWSYAVNAIPMAQVLAPDRADEVTLITCFGKYTPATGYSERLVVRAVRTV
jgi:sortase A